MSVRLSDEMYERLRSLADRTGRSATYYLREAVVEHLEDLEDVYMAEQTLERIRRGEEQVVDAEEFWNGLDS
jgi:RHH-type rel operon transcriptional repressor/antitoxin RelB